MAAPVVAKVPKAKPKKTLKRLMLANPEEINLLTINELADDLIASELSDYFKQFETRVRTHRDKKNSPARVYSFSYEVKQEILIETAWVSGSNSSQDNAWPKHDHEER